MSEREPIGVVGVGWVGLVTAACFAEMGHRVVARDILPDKVEALGRGELPFHEPERIAMSPISANRGRIGKSAAKSDAGTDTSGSLSRSKGRSWRSQPRAGNCHTAVITNSHSSGATART